MKASTKTIQVEKIQIVKEKGITLELNMEEANKLATLFANIGGGSEASVFTSEMLNHLITAGAEYSQGKEFMKGTYMSNVK